MRKILALLCAALLLAVSCRTPDPQQGDAYELYFQGEDLTLFTGGDALQTERIYVEQEGMPPQELAGYLLNCLLEGPQDPALASTIPAGTMLLSLELEGSRAKVDLSTPYRTLSGVALTLADYAIALTLTQIPEISAVSITVRGKPLAYRDRQVFAAKDALFSSNEDVIGTVAATLYYLDEKERLTGIQQMLDLYEGDTQVGAVVKALLSGTEERDLHSALPEGFHVDSVRLEEKSCYVDLPSGALQEIPEGANLQRALQALASSLLSLPGVAEVRYLVDGDFAVAYGTVPIGEVYVA